MKRDPSKAEIGPLARLRGIDTSYHKDVDTQPIRLSDIREDEPRKNRSEASRAERSIRMSDIVDGDDYEDHDDYEKTAALDRDIDLVKARLNAKKISGTHNPHNSKKYKDNKAGVQSYDSPDNEMANKADGQTDHSRAEFGAQAGTKLAAQQSPLSDDSINPVKLLKFITDKWTDDWIDWEPETILQTSDKENLNISRVNQDKVMALKVLIKTTEFFDSWRVFEKVCMAFSNHIVHWGHPQPVRIHEMAAVVALVTKHFISTDFSPDVKNYIAASATRDGFLMLPRELSFADFEFSKALLENGGDEAAQAQKELMDKIKSKSDEVSDGDGVQLLRIIRVHQHVSEYMRGAE